MVLIPQQTAARVQCYFLEPTWCRHVNMYLFLQSVRYSMLLLLIAMEVSTPVLEVFMKLENGGLTITELPHNNSKLKLNNNIALTAVIYLMVAENWDNLSPENNCGFKSVLL